MRILISGAGAVGAYAGAFWARAGLDVTLCDPWPAHVDAIQRDGVRITGSQGDDRVRVTALHVGELQAVFDPFDVVVLAPKTYDTEWMARLVAPHLAADGYVICAQNGLPDQRAASVLGARRVLGCVIAGMETAVWEPGTVIRGGAIGRDAGTIVFKLGELDGSGERARQAATLFDHIDAATTTSDLAAERWSKLVQNAMSHPLPALTGLGDRELADDPRARAIRQQLATEGARVGLAQRLALGKIAGVAGEVWAHPEHAGNADAIATRLRQAKATDWKTSMQQDIVKGRRTEIEDLNGTIVRRGRELGIATPMNDAIARAVRDVEAKRAPVGADHLRIA
ncbi:MAG TPA: 2-dehydropantoate 2-reductase [Kofleriaceae bacterium]|nr:2-dehydropantoate 2-reductase [Kofleriaceae bacterium]